MIWWVEFLRSKKRTSWEWYSGQFEFSTKHLEYNYVKPYKNFYLNFLFLFKEVLQPEFIVKPELQWTEEERRSYKEYEKKVKELSEEQEKYRKVWFIIYKINLINVIVRYTCVE